MVGLALSFRPLGLMAQDRGDFSTARRLHEQRLKIFRELANPGGEAISRYDLGRLAHLTGEVGEAKAHYEASWEIFQRVGNRWGTGWCFYGLGEAAGCEGDYTTGRLHLERSLALFTDLVFKEGIGTVLAALGKVAWKRGQYRHGRERYCTALSHLAAIPFRLRVAGCFEGLAGLMTSETAHKTAAALLGAAGELRRAMGTPVPPSERADIQESTLAAISALGEGTFDAERRYGESLPLQQSVALAIALAG
jgi:tetratricopeptide (TPR) repeat protein